MNILITGATGFVGSRLMVVHSRYAADVKLRGAFRSGERTLTPFKNGISTGNIDANTSWLEALKNIDVVVHLAARVHVMHENKVNALSAYRQVNVDGTLNLARQAAAAGVNRFIFLSSIKVNGEETNPGECYSENSKPNPVDPYGISKYEAEEGLKKICDQTGMEYVVIRPPLIYGPGVKANYQKLIHAVKKGFPLPFGRINNKRSMLALDNLIDFIYLCASNPKAANQIFLLSDGEDMSSKDLVKRISKALGRIPRLLPLPIALLRVLGFFVGRGLEIERLIGSLQIDSSKARQLLGWSPPQTVDEGIVQSINS